LNTSRKVYGSKRPSELSEITTECNTINVIADSDLSKICASCGINESSGDEFCDVCGLFAAALNDEKTNVINIFDHISNLNDENIVNMGQTIDHQSKFEKCFFSFNR